MKKTILHLKRLDWVLVMLAVFLSLLGILSIYSSSFRDNDFFNFKKQIFFLIIGFFLMIIISFFDYRILRNNPYLILTLYFFSLLLLGGLFIFGSEIRGVYRWYKIGVFSFDPKMISSIILIILLAKYFSMRHIEMYRIQHIILSGFYVFLPAFLIFFQPDLGWVFILIVTWMGILIISGIKLRHFLTLLFLGILVFTISWNFLLRDYQKERIVSFIVPSDYLGASWSQNQSRIAIGSGLFFGKGFGRGSQTQYGFLPEPQTDFIFAAIAEEKGFFGVLILFSLILILFWRIIRISVLAQFNFPRFFATGFAIFLFSQIFINLAMNLQLLPVVGIPLPLVSYGGSNLIGVFLGLGILQSIKSHSYS